MRKKKCKKCGRQYIKSHFCKHYHDNRNNKNYLEDLDFKQNINSVHNIIYFNDDNHHMHAADLESDTNKNLMIEKHSSSKSYHFCTTCNQQINNCHCHNKNEDVEIMDHDHASDSLNSDELCSKKFLIRLGGLTNGLTYRLWKLRGSYIKFTVREGNSQKKVKGKIKYVGGNYVELTDYQKKNRTNQKLANEHHEKHQRTIILPFNRISSFKTGMANPRHHLS